MYWWKSISLLVILLLMSCTQHPNLVPHPNQRETLFTDEDLDKSILLAFNPRAIQGTDHNTMGSDDRSPIIKLSEAIQSEFETQAVIPNSRGFIYYIRKETSTIPSLFCGLSPATATWRVIRQDVRTGNEVQFLCSTREIESVAGSSDGTTVFLSRKDTTANGGDFEIFRLAVGSAPIQFTSNTSPDTHVSISGDAQAIVWQGKRPASSIDAVFVFIGSSSFLDIADPQQQPSISANGQFITLVRHLPDGRDRIMRFNVSTQVYTTLFTSTSDLEHPSITDDGTKVAFLKNGITADTILLKTVGVSTLTTLAFTKFTFLEHPHITRDGRWLSYASENNDVFNVFTKHLATDTTAQLTSVTGNVDASNAYWQLPPPFSLETKRTETNGRIFGGAVALEGDILAVGSRGATVGTNTGAVFIYGRNGAGPESWSLVQTLTSPNNSGFGEFGSSVAIHANTLIVGEPNRKVNDILAVGAAYIFQHNGTQWEFVRELVAPDIAAQDNFGFDVDIFADTAVVSALKGDTTQVDSGSIYIFERNQGGNNQWGLVQKRFASDAATGDAFGHSVGIYDKTIVVGSPNDDNSRGLNAGSVYFFERDTSGTNNWGQVRKRVALNGDSGEAVGLSVDIEKNHVAAGAPGALNGSGVVYLFRQGSNNTWAEIKRIFPQDRPLDADLGYSVALSDRYLVAGAWRDNDTANDAGSAYIFNLQQSKSELKLLASDGSSNDHYGFSVALSGDTVVIGAERFADNQGQVYVYE